MSAPTTRLCFAVAALCLLIGVLLAIRDSAEDTRRQRWVDANRWKVELFDQLYRRDGRTGAATNDPERESAEFYEKPHELIDRESRAMETLWDQGAADARAEAAAKRKAVRK